MELQLSLPEYEFLVTILEDRRRELLREIARADHHEFKRLLREKELLVETMLAKLGVRQSVAV